MADSQEMEATAAVWRRGDYGVVGDWFADASRDVLAAGDGRPLDLDGARVLDVACGTGTVAIEAARRGAEVTGLDVTPELLDVARARAEGAGVACRFVHGSFDDLGGLGRYDVVSSAFGVMFATDPVAVAAELLRATEPGGLVSVAAWHRDGALGGVPPAVAALLPAGGADSTLWADPEQVLGFFTAAARLGTPAVELVASRRATIAIPFPSPEAAVETFLEVSGPWMFLFDVLDEGQREVARAATVGRLAERSDPTPDGIALQAVYQVTQLSPR